MNIFNTYKSHFIAAIGSVAFLGLLILLLCIKPFGNSDAMNPDNTADQELPVEFQKDLMDESPLPPPATSQNNTEETAKETMASLMASSEADEKESENTGESIMPANSDSVLVAELRKAINEIKIMASDDSLPKDQDNQVTPSKTQPVLADNTRNFNEERQFYYDNYRSILNLRKVYPYVIRTKDLVDKMNKQLATIKDNRERKRLIKKAEKELFDQFEKDIRNMSTSQGKLLLKLIARETNQTAFGLIKTYKGAIPATFWYGVGLLFHENLKLQYDSIGEDKQLEKIVQRYKLGKL